VPEPINDTLRLTDGRVVVKRSFVGRVDAEAFFFANEKDVFAREIYYIIDLMADEMKAAAMEEWEKQKNGTA
jgi:hypothetical protein